METVRAVAEHSGADGSARTVLLGLAFYAQRETNLAWPSDRELMGFSKLGRSMVQRQLRVLERAGEIARQPRAKGDPRRVYLIDPCGGEQLTLIGDECSPRVDTRECPLQGVELPLHAGAGSNQRKRLNSKAPLAPRKRGELAPNLMDRLAKPPSRRTSRRRRDLDRLAAGEPCPGGELDLDVWTAVNERLLTLLGEQWEIWGAGAHPHQVQSGLLVIAFPLQTFQWVAGRFGRILEREAAVAVSVVGCERLAVSG